MKKELLSYNRTQDQSVFQQEKIELDGGQCIQISGCTIAGNREKPNEDAMVLTQNKQMFLGGVFDGCTSLKPIPALGDQTGARFASHFLAENIGEHDIHTLPQELMGSLNQELLKEGLNLGGSLSDVHTLPASTGTIFKIDVAQNLFQFSHIGDTFCVIFFNDHSDLVTNDLNKRYDQEMFELITKIAIERGITNKEARQDQRVVNALIESFNRKFNRPDGTGTGYLNGDPNAEKYIQSHSLPLDNIIAIFIGSDGITPQGWSIAETTDREKLLNVLKNDGIDSLIKIKHQSEDSDPDWTHVRYKHSDDATGIFIDLQ